MSHSETEAEHTATMIEFAVSTVCRRNEIRVEIGRMKGSNVEYV
jgi:hypothetical protein